MKRKIWKVTPFVALSVLLLVGCATRVRFEAPRMPNMDTTGIQRIAIAPFTTNIGGGANQVAGILTSEVTSRINATNAFQLVSYDMVRPIQARGDSVEPYIDAFFRGRVTHYATRTTQRTGERRVRRGDVTVTEQFTYHLREVEVSFEYEFVRVRDGSIVGPIRRSGRTTANNENVGNLPGEIALANRIISNQLALFNRDVAPHTIRLTRVMESEGRNHPARPAMNAADAMRRGGDYIGARNAYVAAWEQFRSIASAINAAILYEATGDLEGGIFFMETVFEATGAPRVNQKLATLNREAAQLLGLAAMDDVVAPAERVADHAVMELRNVVADGSRLWIHNNMVADQALVNDVIDNMISTLLTSGFTVVERAAMDLIAAERNLHLDGVISDNDFISLGNAAGAETIVVVGLIGTGGARRLQVRVLDIERGTVIMQSNTGVAWRF